MKQVLLLAIPLFFVTKILAHDPDSAYIFSYTNTSTQGRSGLHFAWSKDKEKWFAIGPGFSYVKSDYGSWGSEKRMYNPVLFQDKNGLWHGVWKLDDKDTPIAHVTSKDLVYWGRQSYFVNEGDLKIFTPAYLNHQRQNRQEILILGKAETGSVNKVPWTVVDDLTKKLQVTEYKNQLWGETTKYDATRFAGLTPVNLTLKPDPLNNKNISNMLMGIFFEDINYAADGGLYAELVENRSFEYDPSDKQGRDVNWNNKKAWSTSGTGISLSIETTSPLHENNKHYAILQTENKGGALVNEGFNGISLKFGDKYDLSFFAKILSGVPAKIITRLVDKSGRLIATTTINTSSPQWKKYNAVLIPKESITDARLEIIPQSTGKMAFDMISLFPQKTFNNRKNGLRADLAQIIADMKPRFIRFPGGCVAHGDGIENMYNWKNTIGPLETRKPQRNLWNYHQSMGLGYYEYFQYCEDIGAAPLPVVAAGVPCQNSGKHGHPLGGQQCGIHMSKMGDYVQDVLDLIEWANGDASTKWGKLRATAGHPKPFNLKYIGIGNEDLITDVFEERFSMIYNAVQKKYPDITVIGTVGPFFEGTDYTEGWELASKLKVPVVDEHYYLPPGWFIYNQDFYDKYDRSKPKVYLGEYAAHLPGRPNNLETALAEAIHLTTLERNGDVVHMTSYAPLLAKEGFTQWNPDLIYFNNTEVKPTTGYQVQKLFGNHSGDEYISSTANFANNWDKVQNRVAWSFVRNSKSKELILKIVNMLPVQVNASIDLTKFDMLNDDAIKTVLHGNPSDRNLKPVTSKTKLKDVQTMSLSPYSFTVVKMNVKQ